MNGISINFRLATIQLLAISLLIFFALIGPSSIVSGQTPPKGTARDALLAAMKAKRGAKSFRLKETQSTGGEGVNVSLVTTGEYVAPDKYHAVLEMSSNGKKGEGEALIIGVLAYGKTADGKWQEKQIDPLRVKLEFARLRHEGLIETLNKAKNKDVKLMGQAQVGGSMMSVYQFSFNGPPEVGGRFQTKVWVRDQDGLPHKIEIENLMRPNGLKISSKTTTVFYDYNTDIMINPPI